MSLVARTTTFVQAAWAESKKVTWPTRETLRDSTKVVLAATTISMLFLFVVDRILTITLGLVIR
jgi:preprotein translocase SecE subunit